MAKKQLNVNANQSFLQTVVNIIVLKEITIPTTVNERPTDLTNVTDLTRLIIFFILTLLHTVSKIGMHGLLYTLTYSLQMPLYTFFSVNKKL